MPRAIESSTRLRIIELVNQGYNACDISVMLNLNRRTVTRWIRRYQAEGDYQTKYSNCHGVSALTEEDKLFLTLMAHEDPFKPATKIKTELEIDCSLSTLSRFYRSNDLKCWRALRKTKLNETNRQTRLNFASFYRDFDWRKVIFCDEASISSEKNGIRLVRRPRGYRNAVENLHFHDHSHRKVVTMWGCISYHGLGPIIFLDSALNQFTYYEIIDTMVVDYVKNKFENEHCYLLDDNCRAHRTQMINDWFECVGPLHGINLESLKIPPYSPEFNVIENVWGLLKKDLLNSNIEFRTINDLKLWISAWWDNKRRDTDYCKNLVLSMGNRLIDVLGNDGYPINY